MYVSLELARSTALWASMVLAAGDATRTAEAAARAGLQVSRACRHVGQEAIQLHGGIAMTAEYSVGTTPASSPRSTTCSATAASTSPSSRAASAATARSTRSPSAAKRRREYRTPAPLASQQLPDQWNECRFTRTS